MAKLNREVLHIQKYEGDKFFWNSSNVSDCRVNIHNNEENIHNGEENKNN